MKSTLTLPSKVNILMVDDKPENLKLLTQILSEQEYKIGVSPSGKLALNAFHSNSLDLILLDINMAEMDGYKVYQYLEASAQTNEIPVIFISALDEPIISSPLASVVYRRVVRKAVFSLPPAHLPTGACQLCSC